MDAYEKRINEIKTAVETATLTHEECVSVMTEALQADMVIAYETMKAMKRNPLIAEEAAGECDRAYYAKLNKLPNEEKKEIITYIYYRHMQETGAIS